MNFQAESVAFTLQAPMDKFLGEPVDVIETLPQGSPVLSGVSISQRDSDSTFLVDVSFDLYDPGSLQDNVTVEFKRGASGLYMGATAQPYDRRHTIVDGVALDVPQSLPAKSYVYVWQPFFDLPQGEFDDVYIRITAENNPSDQVEAGPFYVTTVEVAEEPRQMADSLSIIARTPKTILGNGLVQPFRRISDDFASTSGKELVEACLSQILGTRAAVGDYSGEVPWRPDLGSKLWSLRHKGQNALTERTARGYAKEVFSQEPRAEPSSVRVESNRGEQQNELRISVNYAIIEENNELNEVRLPDSGTVSLSLGIS